MQIIDKIRESLSSEGEKGVTELADQLFVSKQAVHSALNQLLENGEVEKLGRTPKTIYRIAKVQSGKFYLSWTIIRIFQLVDEPIV